MVVRLILEHEKPVLILAIHINRHMNTACVDLLGFVEIPQFPLRTQSLHPDHGDVHEGHIALFTLIEGSTIIRILLIGLDERHRKKAALNVHRINRCGKGRMAAMIRPVGINDTQLRDRRGTVLRVAKILLHKREIRLAHRKSALSVEISQLPLRKIVERREDFHIHRHHNPTLQGRGRGKRCLAALHRIDEITLDLLKNAVVNFPDQNNDACRTHVWTLSLRHELHTLRRCRRRRVKLPRQRLDRKDARIRKERQHILINGIHRRIGKDNVAHLRELLRTKPLYVIARNDAHGTQIRQTERLHQIIAETLRRNIEETLPLLHKDSFDSHRNPPS